MPHIIITTQVYPPETHPTSVMVRELAEYLSASGWKVTVCAGWPHHPKGRLYDGYRRSLFSVVTERGVELKRSWHLISSSRKIMMRSLVVASQAFSSAITAITSRSKCDLLLVYGPPIFGPNLGIITAKSHRAKLVNVIYDIYPDIAIETGKVSNRFVISIAKKFEWLQYNYSDLTIVLSAGFKRTLQKKGVSKKKIEIVPVWLDQEEIKPLDRNNRWRRENNIPLEKFVVLYAGTIGVVSGARVVIDAAKKIEKRKDIVFVFVGEGEEKKTLEKRVIALGNDNVVFFPFQPRDRLAEIQATADVGLVTLAKGRGRTSVPSKVLGYMAAGRMVIACVDKDSDTANEIIEGHCGKIVPPGDADSLADAVIAAAGNLELVRNMGVNARKHFERKFTKNNVLKKYNQVLKEALEN